MFKMIIASIFLAFAGMTAAWADSCDGVNCNQPTAVDKGVKAPTWEVVRCVTGPANGPYTSIPCNDPNAVHKSPKGADAVCFLGSDGKIHWDIPGIVREGRTFKNIRHNGSWQPLWKLTKAEKAKLGIN